MNLVFDTSIIIDGLRRDKSAENVLSLFEDTSHKLYMPSIVGFELFSGASSKEKNQIIRIKLFLDYFEVVDLTWDIAKKAGKIFRDDIKGLQVPDYIVAATALEIGGVVVTLNKKHFSKVAGLPLYPL